MRDGVDVGTFVNLIKSIYAIRKHSDTMACRAAIGRHMLVLKNAKSVAAREITEKEQVADHCCCGNQKFAMDTILLWLESLKLRDETLEEL